MQYIFRCSLFRHIVLMRRHFPCRKNCTSSECICAFIEDACFFLQPYKGMCTNKFILSVSKVSSDNTRIHNSNFNFWVAKRQRFHELRYPAANFETQNPSDPSRPIKTHQGPSKPIKTHQGHLIRSSFSSFINCKIFHTIKCYQNYDDQACSVQ